MSCHVCTSYSNGIIKHLELPVEFWQLLLSVQSFTSLCWYQLLVELLTAQIWYAVVWLVCAAILAIFVIFLGINVGIPEVRATVFHTMTDIIFSL